MSLGFFPALFDRPSKIRFAYQDQGEYIELLLRQHWVTNVPWIVLSVIGLLFPATFPTLAVLLESVLGFTIPTDVKFTLVVLWYMFMTAYIIEKFLGWYFNIYIITNSHVVDIDFHNLLSRHSTEVRLQDIQSPRAKLSGVFGSLFNFGNVHIETAAKTQTIDFMAVPKPDLVVDRIQDLQEGRI